MKMYLFQAVGIIGIENVIILAKTEEEANQKLKDYQNSNDFYNDTGNPFKLETITINPIRIYEGE